MINYKVPQGMFNNVHISKQRMQVKHLMNVSIFEIICSNFLLIIMRKLLRKSVLVRKSLFHLFWH